MRVDVVTAVLPRRSQYLPEASASFARLQKCCEPTVDLRWVITIDGSGRIPAINHEGVAVNRILSRSGCSVARNVALSASKADWIVPLDADDEFDIGGASAILAALPTLQPAIAWVGANRLLFDGRRPRHWIPESRMLPAGSLASLWTAPFPFHPNSIAVRRSSALAVGGWPALAVNEDLGLVLSLSEAASGILLTDVLHRYRIWDGQSTSAKSYVVQKELAFSVIGQVINAKRAIEGRGPVHPPRPGQAYGREVDDCLP